MINELKQIIESITYNVSEAIEATEHSEAIPAVTAPLYPVEYEEMRMMNLKADEKSSDSRFAYIEEFVEGNYVKTKFIPQKTTVAQIYFCRFIEFGGTAIEREAIRSQIEREIIFPFIEAYNDSHLFDKVQDWKFFTPPPRFDANEISVMLQFNCTQDTMTKW